MNKHWCQRTILSSCFMVLSITLILPGRSQADAWKVLKGHRKQIACLAISPDNSIVASGDVEGLIRIWDVAKEKEFAVLTDGMSVVNTLMFLDDGNTLVSGSRQWKKNDDFSSQIQWWDLKRRQSIRKVIMPYGFNDLVYSAQGKVIASGTGKPLDGTICVRDAQTGKEVLSLPGIGIGFKRLAISPDGRMLAAGAGNLIKIWDLRTRREIASYQVQHISDLAFRPGCKQLTSVTDHGLFTVFDLATKKVCKEFERGGGLNTRFLYRPNGQQIIMTVAGLIRFLDAETGEQKDTLGVRWGDPADPIALSKDGTILLTPSNEALSITLRKVPREK